MAGTGADPRRTSRSGRRRCRRRRCCCAFGTPSGTPSRSAGGGHTGSRPIASSCRCWSTAAVGAFATTPGAYKSSAGLTGGASDTFVAKLNATGSALIYSTLLNGTAPSVNPGTEGGGIADLGQVPAVARTVVGQGVELYGLVPARRSLEEVFMSLVDGGE